MVQHENDADGHTYSLSVFMISNVKYSNYSSSWNLSVL